jgi:uncharacterized protein YprB with RNaseH-like and TPR domain
VARVVEISEQLARLGLRRGAAAISSSRYRGPAIEELVAGEVVETDAGACLRIEESYPLSYAHGIFSLAQLREQSPQAAARLARDERLQSWDLQKAVFLDTETTGLMRGTGTYVFLVGIGHFAGGVFRVVQFFMRGLEEERAMLQALAGVLDRFEVVVSFNGRAFDVPLLRTRFTLAHMLPRLTDLPHFDLLFPARRLWRARLDSCALGALETEILGIARDSSDVPSWQIPSLYADYLRTGDGRAMTSVVYHNRQDVLSLVVLAAHMCRIFTDPWTAPHVCAPDLYSLGRMYESLGLPGRAWRAYRAALDGTLTPELHDHALRRLSFMLKRQERRREASELWWKGVDDGRQLYPYVELAKYYEWQVRDWHRAAEVTQRALDHLQTSPPGSHRHHAEAELLHRLARLERKLSRTDAAPTSSPCHSEGRGT